MLDSLILIFPKEGIENVLVSLSSFFDEFVFSYSVVHHLKIGILVEQKGIFKLKSFDKW